MKTALLLALASLAPLLACANDTAYTALRVVGRQDKELLNRVVEVRGKGGAPQPEVWKITVDEPRARGGVREFEVKRGKVVSERTPVGGSVGARMNFNQLNLDSEGIFTVVNQEAQKTNATFDRLDYLLKAGTGSGAPVWEVQLHEGRADAGRMAIAADSGTILSKQLGPNAPESRRGRDTDRDTVDRRPPPPSDDLPPRDDSRWSQSGESFRGVDDFFHRLGQRFQNRGVHIKNFFTGEGSDR